MGKTIDRFIAAKLYVITCPPPASGFAAGGPVGVCLEEDYARRVGAACEGGADVIQFRDKLLSVKERYAIASRLRRICAERRVLFIVNDSLDLALAVGADGVHLGQEDLPLPAARRLADGTAPGEFLIGRSTHSLSQALEAQQEGADYIGIGPVFATPTKPACEPVGLRLVREVTSRVQTPHVAIGGIDAGNVEQVLAAGAERVAVVRAVCGAPDVAAAARRLKEKLKGVTPVLDR